MGAGITMLWSSSRSLTATFLLAFDGAAQPDQRGDPVLLVAGHPALVDAADRHRVEVVDAPAPVDLGDHEVGVAQHAQVLHDHVAVLAGRLDDAAGGVGPRAEHVEDPAPQRGRGGPPDVIVVVWHSHYVIGVSHIVNRRAVAVHRFIVVRMLWRGLAV